ncbi:hypothetical protein LOTGIDRAFT_154538 [Lottia gigantea]|uniref:Fibrinogen C-terminal domain-containing protein n=1 Tax=Lottia gigantea TaxID=225164 RepID=V3ZRT3_LOTGI|nr:hypothetical protein LOTGIDRAFT_154538 [Lottia gigantea]ESO87052.1 hypothetical protein LOTGIDRAFT_154538 [Lottia gigantea]
MSRHSMPLLLIATMLPMLTHGFVESKYLKTRVFYEPSGCEENIFYNYLKTTTSSTPSSCGLQCSTTTDCRRIMFDRKTKICLMFESGENCFHHENIEDKDCYRLRYVASGQNYTRCPIGYYGDTCQNIIEDCSDGFNRFRPVQLISYIKPAASDKVLVANCHFNWDGMTYVQYRFSKCLEEDFNRTWTEYVNGFGHNHGEHWLGLQNMYNILQNYDSYKLQIYLSINGQGWQHYYYSFHLQNETSAFRFSKSRIKGHSEFPAGDSLTNGSYSLEGRPFSTYDRDQSNNDCPDRFKGGWWYLDDPVCSRGNLNGRRNATNFESRIHWLDNLGTLTDFSEVQIRLTRE